VRICVSVLEFELVDGLTLGVYCYYILLLYYILLYIYYTLPLFPSSSSSIPSLDLSSSLLPLPSHPLIHSILVGTYIYLFIFSSVLSQTSYLSILKGIHIYLMFRLKRNTHIYLSFILYLSVLTYTYLYSLQIYLISNNSTPHVLSEWMVEV